MARPETDRRFLEHPVMHKLQYDYTTTILEADNDSGFADTVTEPFEFIYEDFNEPKLALLRRDYRLDRIVAGAKSEFEKAVRIGDWLAQMYKDRRLKKLPHVPPLHMPEEPGVEPRDYDALSLLRVADRHRVHCVHLSMILAQSCLSLGIQARKVGLQKKDIDRGGYRPGHATVEIWSHKHAKWAWLDPMGDPAPHSIPSTEGCLYFHRRGVPLSLLEVHRIYCRNAWHEVEVRPPDAAPIMEDGVYRAFFHHIFVLLRNNWFSDPYTKEYRDATSYKSIGRESLHWVDESSLPMIGYHNTTQEGLFNWPIDHTTIHIDFTQRLGTLRVRLQATSPNLDSFLVKLNGERWTPRPSMFQWDLRPGENTIQARTKNKYGVQGPASSVRVSHGG